MAATHETLKRHLSWLRLDGCSCGWGWVTAHFTDYQGWARLTTDEACPHHGT